ncbi:hypothetical protein AJ79_06723 [Helicocarpus griseus UAMH5409]|uniref:Aminoglycoside phosphotransferase domain-containing protein n=1 Tax=Helicocarpus griseus UAMH5409 TaxID=1447875 RepID=A0A2B7XAH9_9EURO|nr:hypothetical protein AJ79_06723 [Helicocarpus griseus UAMH5409]
MTVHNESSQEPEELPQETWTTFPSLPLWSGSTIPNVGRRFYIHSPSTILKLGTTEGEGVMTALVRSILGPCVPRVVRVVTLRIQPSDPSTPIRPYQGLILTRQPGTPLVELWPSLSPQQREGIKAELFRLLVQMRARPFAYYGRPGQKPYLLFSEFGTETHAYCTSRVEWDNSRVFALHATAADKERVVTLEQVQRGTTGPGGWDRPVFTHVDLSERNILVNPDTLAVTGFLDWEMANMTPAYFEYVSARLSGGHQSEWKKELLDVLRAVLRCECGGEGEERYKNTLAAWDAMVDVERIAQGYDDDCYWTFETGMPVVEKKPDHAPK